MIYMLLDNHGVQHVGELLGYRQWIEILFVWRVTLTIRHSNVYNYNKCVHPYLSHAVRLTIINKCALLICA